MIVPPSATPLLRHEPHVDISRSITQLAIGLQLTTSISGHALEARLKEAVARLR